jgi:hypothetical protein
LAWHDGQKPRVLQENVNRFSPIQEPGRKLVRRNQEAERIACHRMATRIAERRGGSVPISAFFLGDIDASRISLRFKISIRFE